MEFEWDPAKNADNLAKHGIDFEDAIRIFDGPTLDYIDDRADYGEERIVAVGEVNGIEIVVVYTVRGDRLRIISAREATKHERENYRKTCG